ncbi:MAG: response regulator [Gemmatimonadales bacterium]|nr:MAG: response regulator [Gemmatimonadales bacterium]
MGDSMDLLFSDVAMPGMSGPELMAEVRRLRPSLAVLLMSGLPPADPETAEQKDPSPPEIPLVQKPFQMEELLRAVRTALDRPPPD